MDETTNPVRTGRSGVMSIPLAYNLRNLAVRRVTTGLTVLGIALVVLIFESLLGLARGIERAAAATGVPENVKVIRKGATSAEASALRRETCNLAKTAAGVAKLPGGAPLATEELLLSASLPRPDGTAMLTIIRGIDGNGLHVYDSVRVARGAPLAAGGGVMIGRAIVDQLGVDVGGTIEFGRRAWTINGVFEAGGAAYESEIWTDLDDLMTDYKRTEVSAVTLRAGTAAEAADLARRLDGDPLLRVAARTETRYYEEQARSAGQVRGAGAGMAIIMAVGAVFAGMNTMFAAVAHRTREIGTLRALGYPRGSILASFLIESLMIAAAAGALGSAAALLTNALSLRWFGLGLREVVVRFAVSPAIVATGFGFSLLIGAAGGVLPARHAARLDPIRALRHA